MRLKQLFYELGRGFAYRRIRHADMSIYATILPLILTIVALAFFAMLPVSPTLLGSAGLFNSTLGVISTLPGFYFAGLAAVATFGAPTMDAQMPAPAPEVDVMVGGAPVATKLTRRLFLSYLFSYLVLLSFLMCVLIVLLNAATPSIELLKASVLEASYGAHIWSVIKYGALTGMMLLLSSMIVTTLHGLYFLTERIHQP